VVLAITDVAVTVWHATVVAGARHAGHADPSFYFAAARNLATGRGLTTDYVWEFLSLPAHVHHYAADYWQPLPSILLSLPMLLTGSHTVGTALAASVVAGALIPVPVAVLAYRLSGSHLLAASAAVVMCLLPRLSFWSVQTESVPFFVLFALTAMAAAAGPAPGRRAWFVAGMSAAAAYLCRSDGVLLLVGLALPLVRPMVRSPKTAVRLLPYAVGAAVLLVPWLVANLVFLHHLLPPTTSLAFLQSYEQLFAYSSHPGLHDVLRYGFGSAMRTRRHALHELWVQVMTAVGAPLMWTCGLLAAINLLGLRDRRPSAAAAPRAGLRLLIAVAVGDLLVQAIVLPVVGQGGTWARSLLAYVPLLFIAALMGARRLRLLPVAATAGLAAGVVTLAVSTTVPAVVHRNNAAGDLVTTYAGSLGRGEQRGDVVVMTRDVWQVTEVTRYRSVMIPSGSFCELVRVAKRYRATDFVTAQQRPELTGSVLEADGFRLVGGTRRHQVYRFPAQLPDCSGKSP
jgi:hypothetical protein